MVKDHEIELGGTVHCTELVSGSNLSGRFTYSLDDGMFTELFSFDDYVHVDPNEPLYLLTENLEVISLHDSFGGPGKRWSGAQPKVVHFHAIHSNIAIAGPSKWSQDDRIKRISFSTPKAHSLLRNRRKIKQLNLSNRDRTEDDWLVLDLKTSIGVVRLSYQAQYHMGGKEPTEVTPRFEIEFHEPIALSEYSNSLQGILTFLCFASGVQIYPKNICISQISLDDFVDLLEANKHPQDHRVLSLWGEDKALESDMHLHGAPVLAHDDEGLAALGSTLTVWLERFEEWREASLLMQRCFSKRNELSGERLLTSCKWLEKTPLAKPQKSISNEDLESIVESAFQTSQSAQLGIEKQRIAGALRSISNESKALHMERLIEIAWSGNHLPRPKSEFIEFLKSAHVLRGRAAHGVLDISDEKSFRECSRAVSAVEALCVMLMAHGLPLNKEGLKRFPEHRSFFEFRHVL